MERMTTIIIISILALIAGGFLFYKNNNELVNNSIDKKPFMERHEAENIVEQLAALVIINMLIQKT